MTKYVIDLPEGVKFIVGKGYVMLSEKELLRIPVENLQEYNAPTVAKNAKVEKRVIELPADMIADLNEYKRARNSFNLFITTVGNSIPYFEYGLRLEDLADWYLHPKLVEFVPKKESKFYIRIFDVFDADGNDLYLASMGNNKFRMTIYTDSAGMFTEYEADKIIADVSNSDVSLTAQKVKVDE